MTFRQIIAKNETARAPTLFGPPAVVQVDLLQRTAGRDRDDAEVDEARQKRRVDGFDREVVPELGNERGVWVIGCLGVWVIGCLGELVERLRDVGEVATTPLVIA